MAFFVPQESFIQVTSVRMGSAGSLFLFQGYRPFAREVLRGKWGVGSERRRLLTEAGYDYAAVQARVNEIVK